MAIVTPGRTSYLVIDPVESTLIADGWGGWRRRDEIGQGTAGAFGTTDTTSGTGRNNIKRWASGAITLLPLVDVLSDQAEGIDGDTDTYRTQPVSGNYEISRAIEILKTATIDSAEYALWRRPDLPGGFYDPIVIKQGNYFTRLRVRAGGSWAGNLLQDRPSPVDAQISPGMAIVKSKRTMRCIARSSQSVESNGGFVIRFIVPGTQASAPDYIMTFHFGQYGLSLRGDGMAELYEYCRPKTSNTYRWRKRDSFRFARQGQVMGETHLIVIFPHNGARGEKFIAFEGNHLEASEPVSGYPSTPTGSGATNQHIYAASPLVRQGDKDEAPSRVTKAAAFQLDVREDMRLFFQFARLAFHPTATIVDAPWAIPDAYKSLYNQSPIRFLFIRNRPTGTEVTGTLINGDATAAYNPATDSIVRAAFVLSRSDGAGVRYRTPILWEYLLQASAVRGVTSAVPRTYEVESYNLSGWSGDPRGETGSVKLTESAQEFTRGDYARLATRGQIPIRLVVNTPVGNTTKAVVLMSGIAYKTRMITRGGHGRREHSLNLVGMWQRLAKRFSQQFDFFHTDPYAPFVDAAPTPWKATDAIRFLLQSAGFSDYQINIPDNPLRLYYGASGSGFDGMFSPWTNYAEAIDRIARNFLGAYLLWEPNGGIYDDQGLPTGAWTLVFGLQGTAATTPITRFAIVPEVANSPVQTVGAYNQGTIPTLPIFGEVEIAKIPPEFNRLKLVGVLPADKGDGRFAVVVELVNPRSFDAPGYPAPDPEHADYIGEEVTAYVTDFGLKEAYQSGEASEYQAACNYLAWRVFNQGAKSRLLFTFTAPYGFRADTSVLPGVRPLRFLDVVSIQMGDGTYTGTIQSVSASVVPGGDTAQRATYQVLVRAS